MKKYRLKPGHKVHWADFDPDDTGAFKDKQQARKETAELIERLDEMQVRLYAENKRALLIVLQGMDTSGKDGTVRHVMNGVNPTSCRVVSFKVPTPDELAHDFLWRVHREVPAKGVIGIFNRSHYEDVLVTRVHGLVSDKLAEQRFKDIRHFEKLLVDNGTTVLKFYLGISKEEQRKRLLERFKDPQKRWKMNENDWKERRYWPQYMKAYAESLSATSTEVAPWYWVPANHKWYRNYVVARIIVETLEDMDPRYPKVRPFKIPSA